MTAIPPFDADLLRRYDRPGPRYTSYPTAPHFHEGFGSRDFRAAAKRSNEDPIPRQLSLYVHVPYCLSPCFYCGCNRVVTRDRSKGNDYIELLEREIGLVAPLFDRDRDVIQLHLGGGTPNFLDRHMMRALIQRLSHEFHFSIHPDRDFSIELDPRSVDKDDIEVLAELGFNRASLGVQDFDPTVQEAVNRIQTIEQTLEVIHACRSNGFRSINVDLIYGLPRQNRAGFAKTLDTVIEQRPDRLAVYSYAHLPELFKPQKQINANELPAPEEKLALLQLAIERLSAAGYVYIGMDHFALPNDDLARAQARGGLQRNFMGYTTHAETDLIGLGVSAISSVGDTYSQNPRDFAGYATALENGRLPLWRGLRLDADDVLRADLIQHLMCQGEINIADIENRYDINFASYFSDAIAQLPALEADGLVTVTAKWIKATERGRMLLRVIAMCFDRYLQNSTPVRFSKAI